MATITLQGNEFHTLGDLPAIGTPAPDAQLVASDLSRKKISDFEGRTLILNIFPSVDTGTCAMSVRKFNEQAANLEGVTVLCISRDLPFAQNRFCGAEGIENVVMLSDLDGEFGKAYHLTITDGPLEGLLSRCIVIINPQGNISYTEQVAETANEPNYEEALKHIG